MTIPATMLEIKTLGCFSISIDGKVVANDWPDETLKLIFCSLLSPLDIFFTWDRICRSVWDVPLTPTHRRQIEEVLIRPLKKFLIKEFGFNPLMSGAVGIKIDRRRIHVDAQDFYYCALEEFRLLFRDEHAEAFEKLNRANLLFTGSYLPGMPGTIIENARHDLDLYRAAILDRLGSVGFGDSFGLVRWAGWKDADA